MNGELKQILEQVRNKKLSVKEAILKIKKKPFEDIDFAKIDLHRKFRKGTNEVIYGAGKTAEQIIGIIKAMKSNGQDNILITRLQEEKKDIISKKYKIKYFSDAKIAILGKNLIPDGIGTIVVATGGTSDIPVAQEAAITAEFFGNKVVRLYDIGVAGLHRLMAHIDDIMNASVIITIAGMEGALASVIGGLADCPVIAVPTSIGYGASFHGLSALLSMLNSCSAGVSVVNIDNGFGAGYIANMINHMEIKK